MSVPHATYHCLYKYVFTIYVQPFCIYEVNRDRRFYCFFFLFWYLFLDFCVNGYRWIKRDKRYCFTRIFLLLAYIFGELMLHDFLWVDMYIKYLHWFFVYLVVCFLFYQEDKIITEREDLDETRCVSSKSSQIPTQNMYYVFVGR